MRGVYRKHHLPNYSVFDEKRYFQAGNEPLVFGYGPITFGVNVCEDMWYPDGPAVAQAGEGGAELLINLSSSPFFRGKTRNRERMLATRAADNVALRRVRQPGGRAGRAGVRRQLGDPRPARRDRSPAPAPSRRT